MALTTASDVTAIAIAGMVLLFCTGAVEMRDMMSLYIKSNFEWQRAAGASHTLCCRTAMTKFHFQRFDEEYFLKVY
jgi:hypothetical protein